MIVAIDGPAGSGKSTTARAVAERLGFLHLDSGALYRGLTWAALREGIPPGEWPRLDPRRLDGLGVRLELEPGGLRLRADGRDIGAEARAAEVTARVSAMAALPAVREWVNRRLRELAARTDVVADGRDIGTVVFPDADLKVFLVASPRTRAERRLRDHGIERPTEEQLAQEEARLLERDRLDSEREVAPLRRAADAVALDTTDLGFDEQVAAVVRLARERGAASG